MHVKERVELNGLHGKIVSRVTRRPGATHLAVIAHGYGEHGGRYARVADELAAGGATVITPDHHGHGLSDGERAVVRDADEYVTDLHTVVQWATHTFPGLPLVMIGHAMGGLIATRYAQQHRDQLAALALSGPVVGSTVAFAALAAAEPEPGEAIAVAAAATRDDAHPPAWHGPFKPVNLLAMIDSVDAVAAGPGFGTLPTLWLHGDADPLAPLGVTRAGMCGLRGEAFEEHVYAGTAHEILSGPDGDGLSDLTAFVAKTMRATGCGHHSG